MSEHQFQIALAGYLHHALPLDALHTAIDHATKSASEGQQKKRRGVKRGVPDYMIVYGGRTFWLELKAVKGVLSEDQKLFGMTLMQNGHHWNVVRSVEEVEVLLRTYDIPLRATAMTAHQRDEALAKRATVPRQPRAPAQRRKPTAADLKRAAVWYAIPENME